MDRLGRNACTYLRNCDLAVEGSPTTQTLMSPRSRVPSMVVLCTPPRSWRSMPRFTSRWPNVAGAIDLTIFG